MARRRSKPSSRAIELPQLDFSQPPAPSKPARSGPDPEQAAKAAIARRARPSAVPDHVRLTLTLDVPRVLAERLGARAIREAKNLEAVVIEILKAASR
jgi:hypothetical protein